MDENVNTNSEYKGIKHYPKYEENPFLERAVDEIVAHRGKKMQFASHTDRKAIFSASDDTTGEVVHTVFTRQIIVDKDEFTKVYRSKVTAFFEVGKQGNRVFAFLQTILQPGQTQVFFIMRKACAFTKYKHPKDVYLGLAQLMDAQIITRSESDTMYFINPLIFFNGDRISFVTTYARETRKKIKNQLTLDAID